MPEPYIGEIRIFAGTYAPANWMFCDGQLLSISVHDALFSLLGTTYGGDGQTTFGLPDLRGRLPIHQGNGFVVGEMGGVENVTLTTPQIPSHTHPMLASNQLATQVSPANNVTARTQTADIYAPDPPLAAMAPQAISFAGGTKPHSNMQPYVCLNFIIALAGIYPQQT